MKAYKLFRLRKDGTLGPLFIDATLRVPEGEWLTARHDIVKSGFAVRPGWHCCFIPHAPHLMTEFAVPDTKLKRVWCEIEIGEDYRTYDRPESQGGAWILAEEIKVVKRLTHVEADRISSAHLSHPKEII